MPDSNDLMSWVEFGSGHFASFGYSLIIPPIVIQLWVVNETVTIVI